MSARVVAVAILRRAMGASSGPVTSENIDEHVADDAVVEAATTGFRRLGIDVVQAGPTSLSIECSKDRFEKVFQTRLREERQGDVTTFTALSEIRIPSALRPHVEDVVLPEAPELFP